jgi:hypothetical protein
VTQITAKVPGTRGKRKATDKRPDDTLTSSSSSDESLSANPPVILVRGCNEVELGSVTTPPNKPVTWQVKPNQNTESAPTITPINGGKGAKLKTNKAGSFSVIATLGACKVVWNVVFVWVKVDPATSVITARKTKFKDTGSSGGWTKFTSGKFTAGNYAWEGKVKMEVLGGGTDKKMGVGKVKIHILQNGVADTLTGNYKDGGTALEVPKGGIPVVDATSSASPFITNSTAGTVTPSNSSVTDASKDRELWSGDSPAGAFPTAHKNTAKKLKSISGINGFETAVAAISDDAPNSIVVHAKTAWSADYKGKVNAAGVYAPDGPKVTKEAQFNLISAGSGGQDAYDAGFETFEPRFNGGTDTTWTP